MVRLLARGAGTSRAVPQKTTHAGCDATSDRPKLSPPNRADAGSPPHAAPVFGNDARSRAFLRGDVTGPLSYVGADVPLVRVGNTAYAANRSRCPRSCAATSVSTAGTRLTPTVAAATRNAVTVGRSGPRRTCGLLPLGQDRLPCRCDEPRPNDPGRPSVEREGSEVHPAKTWGYANDRADRPSPSTPAVPPAGIGFRVPDAARHPLHPSARSPHWNRAAAPPA